MEVEVKGEVEVEVEDWRWPGGESEVEVEEVVDWWRREVTKTYEFRSIPTRIE